MTTTPRRATLVQVAQLAGVDKAIVSRVLNGDPTLRVKDDTRRRVESAIAQLDYVPNYAARQMRTARSDTYGLVIPDFSNPVIARIISGAQDEAALHGRLITVVSEGLRIGGKPGFLRLLTQNRIDGLLIAGDSVSGEAYGALRSSEIPWLFVNRQDPDHTRYVVLDDYRGARVAVEYLIGLGHRSIGHIAGPDGIDTADRRRRGYEDALTNAPDMKPAIEVPGGYSAEGGYAATATLLRSPELPTALFVANIVSAVGSIRAILDAGLRIPEDISVIALHDHALAAHLAPTLSVVQMPLEELGATAVRLLHSAQRDDVVTEQVSEPIVLIPRQSTAPPPHR
ncbi:LacI family DNA-binding transcriptional regulator [uncultured Microbacterium sp.]|uniref:LacI family DNA-binding transcriptional regulator n=1 Tax=uncultured Microbacterium sp. TaxID=191216 RepID=UPI0035CB9214